MLYKKNVDVNNQNDSRSIIFEMIDKNASVLDMGCACGDLAEKLVKLKNCKVCGLEYNPESVKKCISKNIFEEVRQFDLNNLNEQSLTQYNHRFDYVVFGDVLEHLLAPSQTLKCSINYLKDGGKCIVSLPNLSHASIKANLLLNDFTRTPLGILDSTHLHFFTYRTIAAFLAENNLDIVQIAYTVLPIDGYQPHKVSELPPQIAEFIVKDPHSAVFQYILLCTPRPGISASELEEKLKNLDVIAKKENSVFKIKRFLMTKFPNTIKYLEKIR